MDKPLSGFRVLELTTYVAAPVCGRLMADLGADVIKVERPTGDDWRGTGKSYNARFSDDANPVFDIYNSGKRCIALNLKSEDGMAAFLKLMAQADVFITNTRPQALKRLGIAYEDIKERYPRLVYAMLVGYGEKGPDAGMPAFDVTAFWARSGFMRDQGTINGDYTPVVPPFSAGDTVSGMTLLAEINAALLRRERTGTGDCVRSGLFQNSIFTFGTMNIITQRPWGTTFPRTPLQHGIQNVYRCADDEWILIAVGYAPVNLPKIYRMIGHPEMCEDENFITPKGRAAHMPELRKILVEGFLQQPAAYWLEQARQLDVPLVHLQHYADVTEDEQAWANGYLEHVTFRSGLEAVMPASPLSMDSLGQLKTKCAPSVGADTAEVLGELGYTEEEIARMNEAGAALVRQPETGKEN